MQRKVTESDITDSLGIRQWKEKLVMGIFEDRETEHKANLTATELMKLS